ncbi:MAG: hypothetical protein IPM34_10705 [Saprospiraceae bacterium]|nr:hypothetical protein [Saprospiraceae bacterium]
MDFNQIRKWMQKMNQILEVYAHEDDFTQSEKNLLLDYNQRIREAIQKLKVESQEQESISSNGHEVEKIEAPESPVAKPQRKEAKSDLSKYSELLALKDSGDLSGKLESTPIKDISTAFGLNEKIVCQNVLFGGDKGLFENAMNTLNGLKNYDEATQFLCSEFVDKFNWMDETKIKNAQVLLKLVRRRYS